MPFDVVAFQLDAVFASETCHGVPEPLHGNVSFVCALLTGVPLDLALEFFELGVFSGDVSLEEDSEFGGKVAEFAPEGLDVAIFTIEGGGRWGAAFDVAGHELWVQLSINNIVIYLQMGF